jgi:hypothetical protein
VIEDDEPDEENDALPDIEVQGDEVIEDEALLEADRPHSDIPPVPGDKEEEALLEADRSLSDIPEPIESEKENIRETDDATMDIDIDENLLSAQEELTNVEETLNTTSVQAVSQNLFPSLDAGSPVDLTINSLDDESIGSEFEVLEEEALPTDSDAAVSAEDILDENSLSLDLEDLDIELVDDDADLKNQ